MSKPPTSYPKKLSKNQTTDERKQLVAQALADGHTTRSAAKALRTTTGTVAKIRSYLAAAAKTAAEAAAEEPKPAARVPESSEAPRPKLAASEAKQCVKPVDGGRCAYEKVPGTDTCILHQPKARKLS
jgi:transposase-like protein